MASASWRSHLVLLPWTAFMAQACPRTKGMFVVAAAVGEPVPAVHALAADDESVAEGLRRLQEGFGGGGEVAAESGLSVVVEDDEEQGPGVEIDAGVESDIGGRLEATHEGLRVRVMRRKAAGRSLHLRRREPS